MNKDILTDLYGGFSIQGAQPVQMKHQRAYGPNGTLPIKLGSKSYAITGGPYYGKPAGALGIKLAQEIQADCHVDIPIQDFNVPTQKEMEVGVIQSLSLIIDFGQDHEIWAGCMGGMGRTGLLFACLIKVSQELNRNRWMPWVKQPDPVAFVREKYYSHAVETSSQMKFVDEFDAKAVAKFIGRYLTN